jgi:hypothetical protein
VLPAAVLFGLSGCGSEGDAAPAWLSVPTASLAEDLRIDAYEADLVPIEWL